ncbi:hypothetical protein ACVBAX_02195 [Robertmurraya sp. GLU-23]
MRNWRGILLIGIAILLTSCRAATIEVAVPFEVKETIVEEKLTDGAIIMYTTAQEHEGEDFDAISIAYLEGDEEKGWTNEGGNHWEYKGTNPLTVYYRDIYDYSSQGKILSKFQLTYGQVESTDIVSIEGSETGNHYTNLNIIEKEGKRYFFEMKKYPYIRALDKEKKVIAEEKPRR